VQSAAKIYQSINFQGGKVIYDKNIKEKIGQMIVIGFRGTIVVDDSDIVKIIQDVKPGGVSFSDWDIPSNSFPRNIINPQQTEKLISDLQKYSDTPLFTAVDVEGGNVNRLKSKYGFKTISSAQEMAKNNTIDSESKKIAEELKELGFNMDFAPVVDLDINPLSPIIGALERSFSSNPDIVIDNARIFINNLKENNIVSVVKHFPGHGSALSDTHLGATDVTDTYKQEELIPYQKLNEEGLISAVMTAHIINRNIDENNPATLSEKFLQDILRKQIEFNGLIISDDIQMGAINSYSLEDAVISAINAGCDIILATNNIGKYDKYLAYKIRDIILTAVRDGRIKENRILESYNRIISLKKEFRIIKIDRKSLF
jgi:beta-N-acetylhexosaminidase